MVQGKKKGERHAGGLAGKESDVAADEAAALSNIHGLLDSLEKQRQSMLASRDATEVCGAPKPLASSLKRSGTRRQHVCECLQGELPCFPKTHIP